MPIYMKAPYARGSVTAANYLDWIKVDSIEMGVERSISMETGSLAARASGVPKYSAFTITKQTEEATAGILEELINSRTGKEVEFVVVSAGTTPREIVKYTLGDAIVASYSVSGSGDAAYEVVSFTYSKISMSFNPRDSGDTMAGAVMVEADLRQGS